MIDLLDPDLHASGRAWQAFRELAPVAYCPGRRGPGYWAVTGHAELNTVARDPASFSSWWGTRPEVLRPEGALRPLHNLDPPAHAALRSLAGRALVPARLAALAPAIDEAIDEHLDPFLRAGGGDAVAALAIPITARIFVRWLGLPDSYATELATHVFAVHEAGAALIDTARGHPARPERAATARAATASLHLFLRQPFLAGGALDTLRGTGLPDAEEVGLAALYVEAGLPTLADALAATAAELAAAPGRLHEDEVPLAVEEILRRACPILQFARRARGDVTLAGQEIRAGQQVVLWFAAANRDPRVFPDADAFLPRRAPNPHLSFGAGPHRCLGEHLARRVLHAFTYAWLARVREAAPAGPGSARRSSYMRGFTALPLAVRGEK